MLWQSLMSQQALCLVLCLFGNRASVSVSAGPGTVFSAVSRDPLFVVGENVIVHNSLTRPTQLFVIAAVIMHN